MKKIIGIIIVIGLLVHMASIMYGSVQKVKNKFSFAAPVYGQQSRISLIQDADVSIESHPHAPPAYAA